MNGMSRVMAEVGPRLGPALSELHFRYFCDKLAASFCPRYFDSVFRQAPWSSIGQLGFRV